ncbi:transglutaminase family protein [Maritalea mobilis]|uniref:transglutaminase family protein n=1 Tax=Maritalea mobilis TaxID=483324 RepID=UPI001C94F9DA|nr:transglutaminase family protein [Maritalea mobilis]MBY6201004.1 transglutaminase family protein [Maritalea mobilis]
MRYEISLSIGYNYGALSDHARTLVHLLPSDLPGRQTVSSRLLTVDPMPNERRDTTDFFGNAMSVLAFHQPIDQIEFTLSASAERLAPAGSLDLSPRLSDLAADIAAYRSLDPAAPHHFLGASPRILQDPAIADFAASLRAPGSTVRQTVEAISNAVHAEMRFDPEATDVDTPAQEAFANRHGVCQDFSHITITALRSLGIPAGYVSGFLRTIPPPGQPRLEGADAMHAWVSAWCGSEAGWIEVDPTNACIVGADHITVAHGRDYADVAPVKGVLRTSGDQTSHHSVDVKPV